MKCVTKEDFDSYKGILVLAEVREGQLLDCTKELLSEGRRLADNMNTQLYGLVLGKEAAKFAPEMGGYGADKVFVCESEFLAE